MHAIYPAQVYFLFLIIIRIFLTFVSSLIHEARFLNRPDIPNNFLSIPSFAVTAWAQTHVNQRRFNKDGVVSDLLQVKPGSVWRTLW